MSDNHTQTEHRQPDLHRENGTVLRCIGPWTLPEIRTLEEQLATFSWPEEPELEWDASAIEAMDTAGAWLLQRTVQTLQNQGKCITLHDRRSEHAALLKMVSTEKLKTIPPPALPFD